MIEGTPAARTLPDFFAHVVRRLTGEGNVTAAWFGWRSEADAALVGVAAGGEAPGLIEQFALPTRDRPAPGPWIADLLTTGLAQRWNTGTNGSTVAIPLRREGAIHGVFVLTLPHEAGGDAASFQMLEQCGAALAAGIVRQEYSALCAELGLHRRLAETALQFASESVIITNSAGTITWVNQRFTTDSGYSAAEVVGRNPRLLSSRTLPAEFYQRLWRTISRGEVWQGRFANRRKSGELYVEDARIIPFRGTAADEVTHYLAIKRDLTEVMRTESDLADQRVIFNAFLQLSLDAVLFLDPATGEFVDFNEAACRNLGYEHTAFRSLRLGDILAAAPEPAEAAALLAQLGRRDLTELELDLRTAAGESRTVVLRARLVQARSRQFISMTWTDVTEARRREAELHEALHTLAEAQRIAQLGNWEFNAATGRVTASSVCRRILGQPETGELPLAQLRQLLPLDELDRFEAELRSTAAARRTFAIELQTRTPDGVDRHIHVRGQHRFAEDGRWIGSFGTLQDTTDKKRLQEEFMRAQRMESIGMLSAGIAHDLNNVLAPILMAAPMLRLRSTVPGDRNLLLTLEKSAERGASLVRQILSFAQGFSGEAQLLQVKHIVRDIAGVVQQTFPRNIHCVTQLPSDLWPVIAQPTQIHQVLLNLCVNARDAMSAGGQLTLSAENVTLSPAAAARIAGARPGDWLVLHVKDTGSGISPDVQAKMWDSFFTTKEQGKGTGLGLATVRRIVDDHRGFIAVQSDVGRGATFSIYLPVETAAAGTERETVILAHPFRGNNELILVVDDEETILEMTQLILQDSNYRVLTATDGTAGIASYTQHRDEIALVLTDLNMPFLPGAALARVLRHLNPEVRIVAMSGFDGASRGSSLPEELIEAFLPKPFRPEMLLNIVHHVLRGAKPPGPAERPRPAGTINGGGRQGISSPRPTVAS